jgi:hypothetical protein
LKNKSYLDRTDKINMTVLNTAVITGNIEVCQWLFEVEINMNISVIAFLNRAQDFLKQYQ